MEALFVRPRNQPLDPHHLWCHSWIFSITWQDKRQTRQSSSVQARLLCLSCRNGAVYAEFAICTQWKTTVVCGTLNVSNLKMIKYNLAMFALAWIRTCKMIIRFSWLSVWACMTLIFFCFLVAKQVYGYGSRKDFMLHHNANFWLVRKACLMFVLTFIALLVPLYVKQ